MAILRFSVFQIELHPKDENEFVLDEENDNKILGFRKIFREEC